MTLWLYAVSIHTKITVRYTYIVQTLQQNCSSPTVSRFLSPYSLHLAAGGWQNSTPLENGVFQHVSICCVGSGAQEEGKLWRDSPLAMLQQCTLMCEAAISQKELPELGSEWHMPQWPMNICTGRVRPWGCSSASSALAAPPFPVLCS